MIASSLPSATSGLGPGPLARLWRGFLHWRAAASTRSGIAGLDAHLLRDIGFEAPPSDATLRRRLLIG